MKYWIPAWALWVSQNIDFNLVKVFFSLAGVEFRWTALSFFHLYRRKLFSELLKASRFYQVWSVRCSREFLFAFLLKKDPVCQRFQFISKRDCWLDMKQSLEKLVINEKMIFFKNFDLFIWPIKKGSEEMERWRRLANISTFSLISSCSFSLGTKLFFI